MGAVYSLCNQASAYIENADASIQDLKKLINGSALDQEQIAVKYFKNAKGLDDLSKSIEKAVRDYQSKGVMVEPDNMASAYAPKIVQSLKSKKEEMDKMAEFFESILNAAQGRVSAKELEEKAEQERLENQEAADKAKEVEETLLPTIREEAKKYYNEDEYKACFEDALKEIQEIQEPKKRSSKLVSFCQGHVDAARVMEQYEKGNIEEGNAIYKEVPRKGPVSRLIQKSRHLDSFMPNLEVAYEGDEDRLKELRELAATCKNKPSKALAEQQEQEAGPANN